MAKLSTLKFASRADEGAAFVVQNPLTPGEPLRGANGEPSTITLLGMDSATARAFEYEERAARQAKEQTHGEDKAPVIPTAESLRADWERTVNKFVALTRDWSGFEDDDGNAVPCTPDLVRALYEQNEAIVFQAIAFYYDRPRFFGGSATASVPSPSTDSGSPDV